MESLVLCTCRIDEARGLFFAHVACYCSRSRLLLLVGGGRPLLLMNPTPTSNCSALAAHWRMNGHIALFSNRQLAQVPRPPPVSIAVSSMRAKGRIASRLSLSLSLSY